MNEIKNAAQKQKVWENVYTQIKKNIFSQKYKPNEVLSEVTIAKELGVSRTPVTMAMNLLEQEGLIVHHNGKKMVFKLSPEELQNLFDVKISLQCSTVRLAVERKTIEQTERFRDIMQEINDFLESDFKNTGKYQELQNSWLDLDSRFHSIMAEMAGSPMMQKVINDCDLKWHRIRSGVIGFGESLSRNAEDHIVLGNLMLEDKTDQAVKHMKNHLEHLLTMVLHLMLVFDN